MTQIRQVRSNLLLLLPFYWPTPFTGLRADDRYIDLNSHTVVLIWYKRPEIKATGFALALRSHVEVDFISLFHQREESHMGHCPRRAIGYLERLSTT